MFKMFKFSMFLASLSLLRLFVGTDPALNSFFLDRDFLCNFAKADTAISDLPHGTDYTWAWTAGQHNLLAKGDTLYFIWHRDKLTGTRYDLYFDKSTDGGDTWGNDIRVDNTLNDPSTQAYPTLAIDSGGCLCAVWCDGRGGPKRDSLLNVYFSKSCDDGQNWGLNTRVSDRNSYGWESPSIAIDTFNCFIYIICPTSNSYSNWDVYFYRSTTCGQTWEAGRMITSTSERSSKDAVVIVDERRYIYVFYATFPGYWPYDTTPRRIVMRRSMDFGANWSGPIRVDHDVTNAVKWHPSAEADSTGNIYVTWHDERNLNRDIFFSRSSDAGNTWSIEIVINDDPGIAGQYVPSLRAKGSGEVYVCWEDWRTQASTNSDIYCAKTTDGGEHWGKNILVNDTTVEKDAVEYHAHLAVGDDRAMYVAWIDNRNCPRPCDKFDVYFTGLHNIEGVVDSATNNPLSGKEVILKGYKSLKDTTDVFGNYSFELLPRGNYRVFVTPPCDTYFFEPLNRNQKGKNFKWTGSCYTDVETQELNELWQNFSLHYNYPNPFNPETQIDYALPKNSKVKLIIYNVLGQKVKILVDELQTAGYKTVHWDGKDDAGNAVSSGVYFYRLKSGDFSETKKMILMK